jgi:hypothetical protein
MGLLFLPMPSCDRLAERAGNSFFRTFGACVALVRKDIMGTPLPETTATKAADAANHDGAADKRVATTMIDRCTCCDRADDPLDPGLCTSSLSCYCTIMSCSWREGQGLKPELSRRDGTSHSRTRQLPRFLSDCRMRSGAFGKWSAE